MCNRSVNLSADEIIRQVADICRAHGVKHLSLFGSYAKGTQTKYSDIDFVVYGAVDIIKLQEQMEEIPTLTKIDLFEYDSIENCFLKEDIDLYASKIY